MVAIMVANKVPKGAKTTPFGNPNPAEIACFVSGLRVAVKTAKPLCAGSIPARASKTSYPIEEDSLVSKRGAAHEASVFNSRLRTANGRVPARETGRCHRDN
jgi:hypothetical protein